MPFGILPKSKLYLKCVERNNFRPASSCPRNRKFVFFLTGHRTRSDERDQANAYEQFHFSDRLSELGFEGLRRSIRDNSFAPFTELHPGPLQPVKLPPDATSAFSALAAGKFRFRQTPFTLILFFELNDEHYLSFIISSSCYQVRGNVVEE